MPDLPADESYDEEIRDLIIDAVNLCLRFVYSLNFDGSIIIERIDLDRTAHDWLH